MHSVASGGLYQKKNILINHSMIINTIGEFIHD